MKYYNTSRYHVREVSYSPANQISYDLKLNNPFFCRGTCKTGLGCSCGSSRN